tara:strand:- start:25 stop:267 length:243 start_codon:yes stop_codon:yes gene_type:complete
MKNKEEKKLSYLITEMYEANESAKEYLLSYLKDEEFHTIDEYSKSIDTLHDEYYIRIYDLALYELTKRIIGELKEIEENK